MSLAGMIEVSSVRCRQRPNALTAKKVNSISFSPRVLWWCPVVVSFAPEKTSFFIAAWELYKSMSRLRLI
jgi:flavin reductase (DIM6/NTAB) family NADH-FMN oxidoreductase RutF